MSAHTHVHMHVLVYVCVCVCVCVCSRKGHNKGHHTSLQVFVYDHLDVVDKVVTYCYLPTLAPPLENPSSSTC